MAKYKVMRGGYSYNGNSLIVGQVFEGEDKGQKFLDQPAITVTYLGKNVNIPTTYLQKVADNTPVSDTSQLTKYNSNRTMVKSVTRLGGLGAGLYIAHKMKKGTWGYIGFAILGMILGGIVGGQVSNIVLKAPQQA